MSPPQRMLRPLAATAVVTVVTAYAAQPPVALAALIPAADYQQVQLATGSAELGEAMSLAVLPNRSVLHTARNGTVRVTDAAGNTKVAGTLATYTHDEEGLQGIAVDPNFATNRYVYLYYSPQLTTPAGALYLVFTGGAGALFDVDSFTFTTGGGTGRPPVSLRAHANGLYVTADNAGAAPLIANRPSVGLWETFQLVPNADGSVGLRAAANNLYVTAENGGAAALIANRTTIGLWESFDLIG